MTIVRLTEQELRNVVEESVKTLLSELDWQTYVDASRKRNRQGKSKKADDLRRYGGDTFNKQYGLHNYAPEDDAEHESNIDNASLDYMLYNNSYDSDDKSIARVYDPHTKKYERNGIDIIRRRRDSDKDYRDNLYGNFDSAKDAISYNRDGEEIGSKFNTGDIFYDEWLNGRRDQHDEL